MSTEKLKLPAYGGQALIEGVLMRGKNFLAAAMRDPSGKIQIETEKLQGLYTSKIAKIPFLRGLILMWDAIGLGTKYITISANYQTGEDEKIEGPMLFGTLIFSFTVAIGLFFLAPAESPSCWKNGHPSLLFQLILLKGSSGYFSLFYTSGESENGRY
jgi:uncharacterized protein YqhQ